MPAKKTNSGYLSGFVIFWLPVFSWMAVIFYFSTLPGDVLPSIIPAQDILFHTVVYAVLGFLTLRALKNTWSNLATRKLFVFTVLFGTIYGFSDELHQLFVLNRCASGFDVFIDAVGSLLGSFLYK